MSTDRKAVAWPLGLLVLFSMAIRGLPARAIPPAPSVDCDAAGDDARALERCVALRPTDVSLLMDLGARYEMDRQWERAEASYRRALQIDGRDAAAHVRLGRVLLRRGDARAARLEGEAALRIEPGNETAMGMAGRTVPGDGR